MKGQKDETGEIMTRGKVLKQHWDTVAQVDRCSSVMLVKSTRSSWTDPDFQLITVILKWDPGRLFCLNNAHTTLGVALLPSLSLFYVVYSQTPDAIFRLKKKSQF